MKLGQLLITHWNLRNPAQLSAMVQSIRNGEFLPPVEIIELPDGTRMIRDGHHRCLAYRLSGRTELYYGEYIILAVEESDRIGRGTLAQMEAWIRSVNAADGVNFLF